MVIPTFELAVRLAKVGNTMGINLSNLTDKSDQAQDNQTTQGFPHSISNKQPTGRRNHMTPCWRLSKNYKNGKYCKYFSLN